MPVLLIRIEVPPHPHFSPLKLCRIWLLFFCDNMIYSAKVADRSWNSWSFGVCFPAYAQNCPCFSIVGGYWLLLKCRWTQSPVCCDICVCTWNTGTCGMCLNLRGEEMCFKVWWWAFAEFWGSWWILLCASNIWRHWWEYKGGFRLQFVWATHQCLAACSFVVLLWNVFVGEKGCEKLGLALTWNKS